MPDSASQANELRLLEQKRLRARLSPDEEARRAALAAVPAQAPRGFDVNAAAAEVHALCEAEAPPESAQMVPAAEPGLLPAEPVLFAAAQAREPVAGAAVPSADAAMAEIADDLAPVDLAGVDPAAPEPLTADLAVADPLANDPLGAASERAPSDPADMSPPSGDSATAGAAEAAPVYDAAAYGLDPNDPNAVAWAAWYAAQGWDPDTAYAYAQQMNARGDSEASGAALAEPEVGRAAAAEPQATAALEPLPDCAEPPQDAVGVLEPLADADVELPPDGLDAEPLPSVAAVDAAPDAATADAFLGAVPSAQVDAAPAAPDHPEAMPDLPPLELEALDGPADEPARVDASEPEVSVDLGPTFDPEPAAVDAAPPQDVARDTVLPEEPPAPAEGLGEALPPEVSWADHAVPASDAPVDFSAFDAEPSAEASPPIDELPAADVAPAGAETSRPQEPAVLEENAPPPEPERGAKLVSLDDSLELPPPEPIELGDEDILEVGEDVVEVEDGPQLSPAEPAPSAAAPPEDPPAPTFIDAVATSEGRDPTGTIAPSESRSEPIEALGTAESRSDLFSPEPTLMLSAVPSHDGPTGDVAHLLERAAPALDEPAVASAPLTPATAFAAGAAAVEEDPLSQLPEAEPGAAPPPTEARVPGTQRVVIHTADGQVKRGTVTDAVLDAREVLLTAQGARAPEPISVEHIKAIFFMLAPGQAPAEPAGKKVRVTFRDGRQVAGFSPDYAPERPGFFMVPADARTHTARIWVYRSAVRQVSVS